MEREEEAMGGVLNPPFSLLWPSKPSPWSIQLKGSEVSMALGNEDEVFFLFFFEDRGF